MYRLKRARSSLTSPSSGMSPYRLDAAVGQAGWLGSAWEDTSGRPTRLEESVPPLSPDVLSQTDGGMHRCPHSF